MHSHDATIPSNHPLRIACYGFADRNAGSVSSAGFVILETLLRRGHQIDFFGKSSFFRPRDLEVHSNFRFVEVQQPRTDRFAAWLRRRRTGVLAYLMAQVAHREFTFNIIQDMRRHNREQLYDIQLLLGDWAWARIGDVPVVSWVQGPPETDARSIARHKAEIISLCGWNTYFPMRAFALYRRWFGLPKFKHSDLMIVGSQWARQRLAMYGVDPARIRTLPYPTDLERFSPAPAPAGEPVAGGSAATAASVPLILWVGRTVPRKRLDLFLGALSILIAQNRDFQASIIGGFGHFEGYKKLIDAFQLQYPGRLTHIRQVDRDALVPLIRSAAVLVQPSEDENFGSAVAEALACGTPVVLGPSNGTADYMGQGGVRFSEYEPAAVAAAIARAIEDKSLRPNARQAAESNLVPDRITQSLEEFLRAEMIRQVPQTPQTLQPLVSCA